MRSTHLAGLAAACALALCTGVASAKPIAADLRVQGSGAPALTADRYMTDTTRVRTDNTRCNGSGDTKQLQGPTALGLLVDATRANRRLDPLGVSDEFDFGLLVCGVHDDFAEGTSSFWLYKVNHVSPEVGADQYRVKPGDDILWFFSDTSANVNTGDELDLVAPARAERGDEIEVRTYAYDFAGVRRPLEGVLVSGGDEDVRSDAAGLAPVTVDRNATVSLQASLAPHIPSAPVAVCVNEELSECPAVRGETLFGSFRGERIRGTAGPDVVRAGKGRDRILVRRGGRDRVRCGKGRDTVLAGRGDRVARDCEVVRRRGRM